MKRTPTLHLYRQATRLLAPLIPLALRLRARKGKEDPARLHERLGYATQPRPEGPLVWLHGASVGESLMLAGLVEALHDHRPELNMLVTTGTVTSARLMASRLGDYARHQYVPVDTPGAVRRFVDHWKPQVGVFAESELWPNLLAAARRTDCRLALVNARMNDRSLTGWSKRPDSARALMGAFDWIGAADTRTRDGLEDLLGRSVELAGNLKLDVPVATPGPELEDLRDRLGNRPVWLAASTHGGEDPIVLDAHRRLLEQHPDALLILAPRHPERADAVADLVHAAGHNTARRSKGEVPDSETQVWLTDTLGEMPLWFSLSSAALIAGSLKPGIGGHNPIEATQGGAAVISGPFRDSFADIYATYTRHGALLEAMDSLTLAKAVSSIWAGEGPAPEAGTSALSDASGGALERTLTALLDLLNGDSREDNA
ncbi:3-deoxy-D-manno-octulosonic acid transferase [Maricaulis sp. CAU 1757]